MVLRELESSFPAATCASLVQPAGTFLVLSGKKLIVRAGQAAAASWADAAGQEGQSERGAGCSGDEHV